jgi:hypothetical protein
MNDGGGGEQSAGASMPPEIDLALEEYRSVRQEEMVALESQITTFAMALPAASY